MRLFDSVKSIHTNSLLTGLVTGFAVVGFITLLFLSLSSNGTLEENRQTVQSQRQEAGETDDGEDQHRADFANTLTHIAGLNSYFAQELALRRITADADSEALLSMLAQSKQIEAMRLRNLVQDIVIQGLATIDPLEALNRIYDVAPRAPEPDPNLDARSLLIWRMDNMVPGRAEELIRIVYQEWSLSHLDKALEHAQTLGELQVQAALKGVADSRDDLSKHQLLAIARKFNIESSTSNYIAGAMAREKIADPDEAWRTFLDSNQDNTRFLDDGQRELAQSIAEAMLDKHGIDVIYSIDEQLAENELTRSSVIVQFVRQALRYDPVAAIQIAVSLEPDRFRTIRSSPMMSWADIDAFAALDAVFSYDDKEIQDDLLRGVHLSSRTWEDPQALIEHIGKYPLELSASTFYRAITELSRQSPELATTYVADILEHREKLRISKEIAERWSQRDVLAALDWVKSDQQLKDMGNSLLIVVLKELVPSDQQLALHTALEQPLGIDQIGTESFVIQEIAQYDIASAVDMLSKARNQQTKLEAALGIGRLMLEGANSKGVLELSQAISGSGRDKYFESLFPLWTSYDPYGLHQNIDRLASDEMRSKAALALLREARIGRGFLLSEKQVEKVKSYLTSEQLSSLDEILEAAERSQENYERTRYR